MNVIRTTVPGAGVLFHFTTREGQNLAIMVDRNGSRRLWVYGGGDEPSQTVHLDWDEAEQVSQALHSRSVNDRLATLELRLAEITGSVR